jgi:hypothetical protein
LLARESAREPLGELGELMLPPPQPADNDSKVKSAKRRISIRRIFRLLIYPSQT